MRRVSINFKVATRAVARFFNSKDVSSSEQDKFRKLVDIPVLTGIPRPLTSEQGWKCKYRLDDTLEFAIRDILSKRGWAETEINREIQEILEYNSELGNYNSNKLRTVEDFQRTPWYERFNPSGQYTIKYISYEALKILEEELIPPSLRSDPYAHLRRRHMESNYQYERSSESSGRYITRQKLAAYTPEMPNYNQVTRKKFLEFEKNYRKAKGSNMQIGEIYSAWQKTLDKKDNRSE